MLKQFVEHRQTNQIKMFWKFESIKKNIKIDLKKATNLLYFKIGVIKKLLMFSKCRITLNYFYAGVKIRVYSSSKEHQSKVF
jgi:hypothetical protein